VLAIGAVEILRASGFRATRMEDGVVDWRARGLPIAISTAHLNPEGSP
jgi:rhodanese-related sulfurtransferase